MDDTNGAITFLILILVVGGVWFFKSLNTVAIVLILVGAILFFGAMGVAGENEDFNALHEW